MRIVINVSSLGPEMCNLSVSPSVNVLKLSYRNKTSTYVRLNNKLILWEIKNYNYT